jgi:hypothetical protein
VLGVLLGYIIEVSSRFEATILIAHDVNKQLVADGAARRLVTAVHIIFVSCLQRASKSESVEVSNRFLSS